MVTTKLFLFHPVLFLLILEEWQRMSISFLQCFLHASSWFSHLEILLKEIISATFSVTISDKNDETVFCEYPSFVDIFVYLVPFQTEILPFPIKLSEIYYHRVKIFVTGYFTLFFYLQIFYRQYSCLSINAYIYVCSYACINKFTFVQRLALQMQYSILVYLCF
jgi:hypothetical protein